MTHYYVAVLHQAADGSYGVLFPDFPGCISAGDTLDDAIRMGAEALAFHASSMEADGEPVPPPASLAELRRTADWVDWIDGMVVMIPRFPATGRSVRINITIDERLLSQIDAVAVNRSAFLADAARRLLEAA